MNWHARYLQQAKWTHDLRAYIFDKIKLDDAKRVLEVGCGTGAILSELSTQPSLHGLDLDWVALTECRVHAPAAALTQGDALNLPYADNQFDIAYCHFLLLWTRDPLQAILEMKRVTRSGGYVIAFAEPDYSHRIDQPSELAQLGKWQTEALSGQGADPALGARLAELFFQAGIEIAETGTIQGVEHEALDGEWESEWAVIESDLAGRVPKKDIRRMKLLAKTAQEQGTRVLHVPTYFAWGHT